MPLLRAVLDEIPALPSKLSHLKLCSRCRLSPRVSPDAKEVVVGAGNLLAKMLIIGQSPGEVENRYGYPFIGPSHVFLDWLERLGFAKWYDYFICNALFCHPPGNREAKQDELSACRHNLSAIIDAMPNLRLVVLLGRDALRAVEGKEAMLSARAGMVGKVTWHPSDRSMRKRVFYSYPLKHPVSLDYIENELGKRRAENEYLHQLKYLRRIYDNVEHIEEAVLSANTKIAWTEEVAYEEAERLLSGEFDHIAVDFETLAIKRGWGEPIAIAIATSPSDALVVPFKQCVPLLQEYRVKGRKKSDTFTMRWQWKPWHSDSFEQNFMQKVRPLFDATCSMPGGAPSVCSWHANFEQNVFRHAYAYDLTGSDEQFTNPVNAWPFDVMAAYRLVTSSQSMSLSNVLWNCMPLEAAQKNDIEQQLTETEIEHTGYGLLALKPSVIAGTEQMELGLLGRGEERLKCEILFERASFDARMEFALADAFTRIVQDTAMSLESIGKADLVSEIQ